MRVLNWEIYHTSTSFQTKPIFPNTLNVSSTNVSFCLFKRFIYVRLCRYVYTNVDLAYSVIYCLLPRTKRDCKMCSTLYYFFCYSQLCKRYYCKVGGYQKGIRNSSTLWAWWKKRSVGNERIRDTDKYVSVKTTFKYIQTSEESVSIPISLE